MTLLEAIKIRRSRRKYLTTPIEFEIIEKLDALAKEHSAAAYYRSDPW